MDDIYVIMQVKQNRKVLKVLCRVSRYYGCDLPRSGPSRGTQICLDFEDLIPFFLSPVIRSRK